MARRPDTALRAQVVRVRLSAASMIKRKVNYREYAAKGVIETTRKVGVCLLVDGPHVRSVPQRTLRRYPGLVHMVKQYAAEIRTLLDAEVE